MIPVISLRGNRRVASSSDDSLQPAQFRQRGELKANFDAEPGGFYRGAGRP